jgi:hypothetical protein
MALEVSLTPKGTIATTKDKGEIQFMLMYVITKSGDKGKLELYAPL